MRQLRVDDGLAARRRRIMWVSEIVATAHGGKAVARPKVGWGFVGHSACAAAWVGDER